MVAFMRTRADLLCDIALSQVGVTEQPAGSNRTPYGVAYGLDGVPWCSIFVWWCCREAGVDYPHTAYVPTLEQWARLEGRTVPVDEIRRGDIICLDFTNPWGDGSDHVEIALGPAVDDRVPCVGGNTSDTADGSVDNGGGVFTNQRPVSWVATVVRLDGLDDIIDNEETDMMRSMVTPDGTVVLVHGLNARPMQGTWPEVEEALRQMIAAGLVQGRSDGGVQLWPINRAGIDTLTD